MNTKSYMGVYVARVVLVTVLVCSLLGFTSAVFAQEAVPVVKETPAQIEVIVREAFADNPIMIHIAKCESTFRQFYNSGSVFKGAGRYVGIFQIDEIIHTNAARALGFDINTVQGNIGYAKHIFEREGSRPWLNCSRSYVQGGTEVIVPATPAQAPSQPVQDPIFPSSPDLPLGSGLCSEELRLTAPMRVGDRDGRYSAYQKRESKEVALLQKHINRILGSVYQDAAGPVDGIFGPLTKRGVERLQTALNQVLIPQPLLVIDGIVGPFTRSAVNNSCGGIQ